MAAIRTAAWAQAGEMRDALDWIQPGAAVGDEDLLELGPRRPRPTWLDHVSGWRARLPKFGWLAAAPSVVGGPADVRPHRVRHAGRSATGR